MEEISKRIIGRNVKSTRKSLGLSQLKFSELVGISKPSVINVESGNKGYNIDLLDKIINVIGYSLKQLSGKEFKPDIDLRARLIAKHKNDPRYSIILNQKPPIVYAIGYELIKGGFLNEFKETNEIKKHLLTNFGWDYQGTSITNTLTRMPEKIITEKHPEKGNTNWYKKK